MPDLIMISFGVQKLIRGVHRQACGDRIGLLIMQNKESRLKVNTGEKRK
jgi:hypothetical protein